MVWLERISWPHDAAQPPIKNDRRVCRRLLSRTKQPIIQPLNKPRMPVIVAAFSLQSARFATSLCAGHVPRARTSIPASSPLFSQRLSSQPPTCQNQLTTTTTTCVTPSYHLGLQLTTLLTPVASTNTAAYQSLYPPTCSSTRRSSRLRNLCTPPIHPSLISSPVHPPWHLCSNGDFFHEKQ